MRIFLLVALVALVRAAPYEKQTSEWEEWGEDLGITEPKPWMETSTKKANNVCWGTSRDGTPVKVCCEGFTGSIEDGCPNREERRYRWSEWVIQSGSSLSLNEIRSELREPSCNNVVPKAIECQTVEPLSRDYSATGQEVTCDRRWGLKCRDEDQPDGEPCLQYKVRILCPVKDQYTRSGLTCIHEQMEYNIGEEVNDGDCLSCTCKPDGRWDCSFNKAFCKMPTGSCGVGETVFQHGETTTLDCKICTCDNTTGWDCETIDDPTCVAPPEEDYCRVDNHFIYFHGQTAQNDCNTCICKNRQWDCTQLICPQKTHTAPSQCFNPLLRQNYIDGAIIRRDCNICVCTQGKWDCTRDDCKEGTSYENGDALSERKVCTTPTGLPFPHGATISQDCNACKCFDGKWQCTRRYCSPSTYPNSTCMDEATGSLLKSGQTIRRGCNICICNGGNLTCSSQPCETNSGLCFDEQRRFETTSTSFDHQYRPSCNPDGFFTPVQCNPLHGVCFCVTVLGQPIPGTVVKQDTGSPNCSPYTDDAWSFMGLYEPVQLPSEQQRDNHQCVETVHDNDTPMTGYNTPKCLPDGSFAPLQCDLHAGMCYCVTAEGETIPGTVMHVSQGRPNCQVVRVDTHNPATSGLPTPYPGYKTPCQQEKRKAERYKLPFIPECDLAGDYVPLQINQLTGVKFCVDFNGVVDPRTITRSGFLSCDSQVPTMSVEPFTNKVDPSNEPHIFQTYPVKDVIHKTPHCKLQRLISHHVSTIYEPDCRSDGRYMPTQCPEGTGVCFCVDVTGAIIPKTVAPRHTFPHDCTSNYGSIFDVVTPVNTTTIKIQPQVSLIHSGWEPRLRGALPTAGNVGPQYNSTATIQPLKTNMTACIRQQQIATMVPGVFFPSCNHNGTFNSIQHPPLSSQVFCVDKNGVKIESTERNIDQLQQLPECEQYWNTTVEINKVKKHWTSLPHDISTTTTIPLDELFPAGLHHHPNCSKQQEIMSRFEGGVVPTCEPNGTYTALQCNATTGVCYCILPYGDVLPDTVLPMVKGTPNCWHVKNASIMHDTTPLPDVCHLPIYRGPCRSRFPFWAFSTRRNKCIQFFYSGCRGNSNRFETQEECEHVCEHVTLEVDQPSCHRELDRFNRKPFTQRLQIRRPSCSADGNYEHRQCYLTRNGGASIVSECECVDRITGQPQDCQEETTTIPTNTEQVADVESPPAPVLTIDGCQYKQKNYARNTEFFKECNACLCLGNNQTSCTNKYCPPEYCYHEGIRAIFKEEDCKRCVCIGGQWNCTTIPKCQSQVTPITTITVDTCQYKEKTYSNGETFYDVCNLCHCRGNNRVECDQQVCNPSSCYVKEVEIKNGESQKFECKTCICNHGSMHCEDDHECLALVAAVQGKKCQYKGEMYTKGDQFYDRCNECRCLGGNQTACDRKACNPTSCFIDGVELRNGQSQTYECRTCFCFNTIVECAESPECLTDLIVAEPEIAPSTCMYNDQIYNDGEQFFEECKACRCVNGEAICEDKVCSPNLCYKMGIGYEVGKVLLTNVEECICYNGGFRCHDKPQDAGPPEVIECYGEYASFCHADPCSSAVCPINPSAICVPDYCTCQPAFFDTIGNQLTC